MRALLTMREVRALSHGIGSIVPYHCPVVLPLALTHAARADDSPMLKLAAFADEISPELDEQIRVCRANDITHFELRGVRGLNVLDFPKELREEIRDKLQENAMGVVSIGSPIGKAKISESWEHHLERFKVAVELAEFFEAPFIRIFSYYPPEPEGDIHKYKDEVVRRMREDRLHPETPRHARPRERGVDLRRAWPGVPGSAANREFAQVAGGV